MSEVANFTFSCMFFLEMVLKMIGLTLKSYVRDPFNIFDAVIVFIWLIEVFLSPPSFFVTSNTTSSTGGVVLAFRTFRLLRIFKLAR